MSTPLKSLPPPPSKASALKVSKGVRYSSHQQFFRLDLSPDDLKTWIEGKRQEEKVGQNIGKEKERRKGKNDEKREREIGRYKH